MGTCQFPTLGFVVDRYKRVKSFTPEPFWYIEIETRKENKRDNFQWVRGHFFDKMYAVTCFMIDAAKVENLEPYQNRIKTETKFPSIPIDNRGVTKRLC